MHANEDPAAILIGRGKALNQGMMCIKDLGCKKMLVMHLKGMTRTPCCCSSGMKSLAVRGQESRRLKITMLVFTWCKQAMLSL